MGLFKDLGFKKNSNNEIVSPNSAKFNGKTFAECQTELVNRIKSDVILSTDADGVASFTSFANVNKPDFFGDGSNVATYFFDGDVKDARGKYNGVATGVTYNTGKFGNAINFPATNTDKVQMNSTILGATNYSISIWYKTSVKIWSTLFTTTNTGWYGTGIMFTTDANHILFSHSNGAGTNNGYAATPILNDGLWHHYVAVRNGSTIKLYQDGVLKSTNTLTSNIYTHSYNAYFGGFNDGVAGRTPGIKSMDQLRVFNRVLTDAEVTALYNEPIPQNILFQEATQNSWFKYKATAYDLTTGAKVFINGSEQVGTSKLNTPDFFNDGSNVATYLMQNNLNDSLGLYNATPTNITYTTGRTNQGALFSSTSSATTNLMIPNIFSISFWIKPTLGIGRTYAIFGFNGDAPTYITGSPSTAGLSIHRPGVTEVYTTANVLTLNAWNHVVLTCSSLTASTSNQKWYVNGVQVATTLAGAGDFNFGKFYFKPFTGILDTTRIFNRVLTTAEISELYTDGSVSFNEVRTDTRKLDVVITGGSASKVDIELYTGGVV